MCQARAARSCRPNHDGARQPGVGAQNGAAASAAKPGALARLHALSDGVASNRVYNRAARRHLTSSIGAPARGTEDLCRQAAGLRAPHKPQRSLRSEGLPL